jgi:parallel beta-helix repeat protein
MSYLDGATARRGSDLEVAGLSVRSYGAVGDGVTDDYGAFAACTTAAISAGVPVVVPPGDYVLGTSWVCDGLKGVIGFGAVSKITATHVNGAILRVVNVTGGIYRDLKLVGAGVIRDSDNYGLFTELCDGILIDNVEVSVTAAVGIYNYNLTNSRITNCYVHDTLADGIHVTKTSSDVTISGNTVESSGDDAIAVVDYSAHDAYVDGITITGNTVRSSGARGIANIGASNVTISGNVITTTTAQGILVSEDGVYGTRVPEGTTITGNTIRAAGTHGVEVEAGSNEVFAVVANNMIVSATNRGVNVSARCVDVSGNYIVEPGGIGVHLQDSDNSSVNRNTVIRAVGQAVVIQGQSGTHASNIGMSLNNAYDCNTASTAGVDSFFARYVDGLTVVGNSVSDPDGQTDRAFELIDCIGIRFTANMPITETGYAMTNSTDVRRDQAAGSIPSVTGSRASNAALASLLTTLAATGIITDGTSA